MQPVEHVLKNVLATVEGLLGQPNVGHPTFEELRREAERYGTRTKFGNYNFVSTVKNRSAWLTVYIGGPKVSQPRLTPRQKELIQNAPQTVELVYQYLKKAPLVCAELTMGDNPYFNPHCTYYVSVHRKEMARLAYMVSQTLFPRREHAPGPKLYLVQIPEWQEKDRQILVFPEVGVTYVLGSDYYGEAKKGFLRMAMWFAKQEGMLGVHAGSKIVRARGRDGKIRKYGVIMFGLSATGKTTHICHSHDLTEKGEGIEIAQDDVVFLREDGSALGSEKGFYLKTGYLNPKIQPIIYEAAISPDCIFENVMVDFEGNVYFDDETLTGNGRGIMQRRDLGSKNITASINLPPVSELNGLIVIFITRRNTVVPIASKLTPEQAAAAFMLGEAIETSASDPRRAGESVREVGTNPFIVGSEAEEGNIFYELLKKHTGKIECYLLNTGGVGELVEEREGKKTVKQEVTRVEIPEMAAIIRGIARGTIKWKSDPHFGVLVPEKVEGIDMAKFDLSRFYSKRQIGALVRKLEGERRKWLGQFEGLNPAIASAV